MKRNNQVGPGHSATATATAPEVKSNGHVNGELASADLSAILASLQQCSRATSRFACRDRGPACRARSPTPSMTSSLPTNRWREELKRVGQAVGKEGRTRERTRFRTAKGAWGEMEVSVNTLVEDLLRPTTEVTRAIAAVAQGNLTQTVRLDVDGRPLEGEFLRSANIVNTMIQQLSVFTSEVTRVAREVGTDGKLGGQAVGTRRGRHLEGPHRFRQLHGQQPDRARYETLPKSPPPWPAATSRARSPSTCAAKFCSSRKPSTPWSTSSARSLRK